MKPPKSDPLSASASEVKASISSDVKWASRSRNWLARALMFMLRLRLRRRCGLLFVEDSRELEALEGLALLSLSPAPEPVSSVPVSTRDCAFFEVPLFEGGFFEFVRVGSSIAVSAGNPLRRPLCLSGDFKSLGPGCTVEDEEGLGVSGSPASLPRPTPASSMSSPDF